MPNNRVELHIDLAQLAANFAVIRERAAACRVMAVIKADAYGLGVRKIAETLKANGADMFGVATVEEALEILDFGLPVQILGALQEFEIAPAVNAGIICPLPNFPEARRISQEAVKQGKTAEGAVAVDTGMGRLGMPACDALPEILEIAKLPNLKLRGLYAHFSSADMPDDPYTAGQIAKFRRLHAALAERGICFSDIHHAASDGISHFEAALRAPFTVVRSGIDMYGLCGSDLTSGLHLRSVISLHTCLAAVRRLPAGSAIGYSRTCVLEKETLVGTLTAGYADGIPLALSNRGHVLINGVPAPVIGRVSMDYTTVDLNAVPNPKIGGDVLCIGTENGHAVTLRDWARLKGTHPHELLCSFGPRTKRIYLQSSI